MAKKVDTSNKAGKIKRAAAIVAITAATACNEPEPELVKPWQPEQKQYAGDAWEKAYIIPGPGAHLAAVHPKQDMFETLADYLLYQGGGTSGDLNDSICWTKKNGSFVYDGNGKPVIDWSAFAPGMDPKDGRRKHTSNDITWKLFNSPAIAKYVGYTPTSDLFYEMPENIRVGIIRWHVEQAHICDSDVVNFVAAYCVWGTGSYLHARTRFIQLYGDMNTMLKLKGEYWVFWKFLECRRDTFYERNRSQWGRFGRGWNNGFAQFHRVFKVYCKN